MTEVPQLHTPEGVSRIQAAMRDVGVEGWLLYDFHHVNPVAAGLTGRSNPLRRYFLWIPAEGRPTVVMHSIEGSAWRSWPWERWVYTGWRELETALGEILKDVGTIAMEVSPGSAVPTMDLVPSGVVELVGDTGTRVVSSGDLVATFHSRWTDRQLEAHRRSAEILRAVAREAFDRAAGAIESGAPLREGELAGWIRHELEGRGLGVEPDCIVGIGSRASDPHYEPDGAGEVIDRDRLLLIDLWAKGAPDEVFADQTWMGYMGEQVPADVVRLWEAVRDARDAGVDLLRERAEAGEPVRGYEVDDVVRGILTERGYGEYFIHRTGHSIDTELHGSGANLDHLETRDDRMLVPGVGFSVEPGIYIAGEVGLRSEINVYMGESGPEVTPSEIQTSLPALLSG